MFNLRGIQKTFPRPNKKICWKEVNWIGCKKKIERVDHPDRSLLLKHCKSKLAYILVLLNKKEIINRHQHMLSVNSSFKEIFNNIQPMIAFRKKTSLKQLVEKKQNKKQPRIFHTYTNHTNHNSRPIYTILHHSITLLPTISQNSNIYKHVNERDLYNLSSSHLPP